MALTTIAAAVVTAVTLYLIGALTQRLFSFPAPVAMLIIAVLLDLSPDTVNEFARRNIIPAFKKGRQWRFRKRDITSVKRQLRGINAAA